MTSSALSPAAEKAAASEPLEVPTNAVGLSPVASNARKKPACEEKHRKPDDISRSNDVASIIISFDGTRSLAPARTPSKRALLAASSTRVAERAAPG